MKRYVFGLSISAILLFLAASCSSGTTAPVYDTSTATRNAPEVNLDHLDHLGESIETPRGTMRIIHIYSEAPAYEWVGDADEGIACVDDAARAAVVYLKHFELTGDQTSRHKAEALLRFIMYMQAKNGLFYNFVLNNDLQINTTHQNSRADEFGWWAARAVWALGRGAEVLAEASPELSIAAARSVRRTFPYLHAMLEQYGETTLTGGRITPRWIVYESAADATSELLLGLVALNRAQPSADLQRMIDQFAKGIRIMQYGSMNAFPYGAHASYELGWHGWGNSQTQALAEAGWLTSARREAEHFYPRILVMGWMRGFSFAEGAESVRTFPQIAYAVRCVSVGLVRLYEVTGAKRYARLAGIAASWFTGNNPADTLMYDEETGRGYDGILSPTNVNFNAGAESTIEALYTLLEVNRHPAARQWVAAEAGPTKHLTKEEAQYVYRVFTAGNGADRQRLGLVMNMTTEQLLVLEGEELQDFLAG